MLTWTEKNQYKYHVGQTENSEIWYKGLTENNIKRGFEVTGIYLLNRQKYKIDRLNSKKLALYEDRISKVVPIQDDGYPLLTQEKTAMLDEINYDLI